MRQKRYWLILAHFVTPGIDKPGYEAGGLLVLIQTAHIMFWHCL